MSVLPGVVGWPIGPVVDRVYRGLAVRWKWGTVVSRAQADAESCRITESRVKGPDKRFATVQRRTTSGTTKSAEAIS